MHEEFSATSLAKDADASAGHPSRDDGEYSGPTRSMTGRVKFYDMERGIGFLYFDDGAPEAFMHASVLARANLATLVCETTVVAEVSVDERGRTKVRTIVSTDVSTVTESARRIHGRGYGSRPAASKVVAPVRTETLAVKWYDTVRGYGFFEGANKRDVFVHASVIQSSSVGSLGVGDRYDVDIADGEKGLMATALRPSAHSSEGMR